MSKVSMIIQSHLSDAMIEMGVTPHHTLRANVRMQFVKFLVHHFPDTNTHIDADEQWEKFLEKTPSAAAALGN